MNFNRKTLQLASGVAVIVYVAACVALNTRAPEANRADRGFRFPHDVHIADGTECSTCHDFLAESPMKLDHAFCALCHEVPEEQPTAEACGYCHTRPDNSVSPRAPFLLAELKFDHRPHVEKEVACSVCHADPDARPISAQPLKAFCMDCHGEQQPSLNDCPVCHRELNVDVVPKFRRGMRLAHDAPQVWEHAHGREARVDTAFCAQCHAQEEDCEACHAVQKPMNHTVAWKRRTHGLHATWDRQSCAVCHEEDSCLKCHQNTQPDNHRGRFGAPVNTHCIQCHFPAQNTNCTVCHEEVRHRRALPSPHLFGVYPPDCARCHPGGLPTRAPHLTNSTVRCIVCHN